jgi:hypothetical protein
MSHLLFEVLPETTIGQKGKQRIMDIRRTSAIMAEDEEIVKLQKQRAAMRGVSFTSSEMDNDIYGGADKSQYAAQIQDDDEGASTEKRAKFESYKIADKMRSEINSTEDPDEDVFKDTRRRKIAEREDEYQSRHRNRRLSPERQDPFSRKKQSKDARTYKVF